MAAVAPTLGGRTPDRCLLGLTQERWTELRAVHDAMRAGVSEGCLLPDGGRAPTDAGQASADAGAVATDGGGVEAIDAGADAGTPTGAVVTAGCGCRAGGDARAKEWWALALVALWRRRRSR
ncbi:MAG: MYXO-CTERM sorting domain-containing protein [Deltaproteobacteria bacterium]|nr:MYXO-CTERM sorting domain-containing protein [Myxococcales bacterium]MDP3214966.1 MYXO-CTERM sorting domain-containing protein [Deltaproteobacteria bacterium]